MSTSLGVSRLEALLESAQLLHSSLDLDDLLRHLLRSVMGRLLVSRALIAVREGNHMHIALARGLPSLKAGAAFDEAQARQAGIDLILPIGAQEAPVGLLAIVTPPHKVIDHEETGFLNALLGIAASGIENARAHDETRHINLILDQKVQELRTLLEMVRELASALEPDDVARLLMLTLAGRWAIRKYGVIAWRRGHLPVSRQKGIELPTVELIEGELPEATEGVRVADLPPSRLKDQLRELGVEIIFPMRSNDEASGLVALGPRPGDKSYSESDLEFGAGLVAQAAVAFQNSWFIREAIEQKKIEQELELAASIQENLFPSRMPHLEEIELAARNRPARQCGGDYYDALPSPGAGREKPYLLCVADVSGKGLPASLLMSNMQATLRALLGRIPSLTELAAHTNELLYATTPSNKYVTAILLIIDPASGQCSYVSAGHLDCLLLRADGEAHWLKATGTPLGLIPGMTYDEETFILHPGDLIALYSDGVTEAQDESENEFGEERLADLLRCQRGEQVEGMVARVYEEIDRFAGHAPQYDDITLMILRRTG